MDDDGCSYMEITVGEPAAVNRTECSATHRLTSNSSETGFSGGAPSIGSNAQPSLTSRMTIGALPPIPGYAGNKRNPKASAQSVGSRLQACWRILLGLLLLGLLSRKSMTGTKHFKFSIS
jgi:hypothetical protein